MPQFSDSSMEKLSTAHEDLQTVLKEAIKYFDFSIVYGHRPPELQFNLFKKGRKKNGDKWTIYDNSKVVTYVDGYRKKSKHNYSPSEAVDIAPYPIDWGNEDRFIFLAGHIMQTANIFKDRGIIDHAFRWGGDWDGDNYLRDHHFSDLGHFEIIC